MAQNNPPGPPPLPSTPPPIPTHPPPGIFSGGQGPIRPVPAVGPGQGYAGRVHSAPPSNYPQQGGGFGKGAVANHRGITLEETAPDTYVIKYDVLGSQQIVPMSLNDKSNEGIRNALHTALNQQGISPSLQNSAAGEFFSTIYKKQQFTNPDGCGQNIVYNPFDPKEKKMFDQKIKDCEKKNEYDKQQIRSIRKGESFRESKAQLDKIKEVGTAGSLIGGIAEYFSSTTAFGNADQRTWIILAIYVTILIIFPLMMWGIMTRELKKYKAYKSVFFGLYLASFLLVVVGMFFIKARTNQVGYISDYGGFLALVVFAVMSLIMGWKGTYWMLKNEDD